ncbi:hypothetical protein C7447_103200 [Tenacibaculum adriaticum]|uniref:Hemolysin activation/secretion protein n=1 Tax=Tenacibaculum adriaticum TaxID=413713 RepID=A0A5S5DT47_9FLAO|nr:hypothetical protein [Tenacibaculum adriaticum]TYP98032.1 hypothetical protein C7447_103200 [Tenacibaculum adriaticum]
MTVKFKLHIYIVFLFAISNYAFAQELTLKLTSKDSLENSVLKKIDFKKNHTNKTSIEKEINIFSEKLRAQGYFLNRIDSTQIKDSNYTAYFSLGQITKHATITIPKNNLYQPLIFKNKKTITIPLSKLSNTLLSISNELEKTGKSFSEVKLINIKLKKTTLFADLSIIQSKKRKINKIIIKGYEQFSKSHIRHFLNININTVFNHQKLKNISSSIKSLEFVSEIKPPEILFSKDSTILYLYLKKNSVNNFDGLLNFNPNNTTKKGISLNGHLNLNLNNTLHTGEQFKLLWKANGNDNQDLQVSASVPYIFNSGITTGFKFNIHKQDSTFLSTRFNNYTYYNLNPKTSLGLTFDFDSSNNTLKDTLNNDIANLNSSFIGFLFKYQAMSKDLFFNKKFFFYVNPKIGSRTSSSKNENQLKIDIETSFLWGLNQRSSIYIKNTTGYLNSTKLFKNELYRIGGVNSIRGFNEQSIFTSQFSFFNIEYRYLTLSKSYLYSITDLASLVNIKNKTISLLGIGVGYNYRINSSQINLNVSIGKETNKPFDYNSSKLSVTFINYF